MLFVVGTMWTGAVQLIVCSGVGYAYFKSDVLPWNVNVNMKIMFGCGIGVFIILFGLTWVYLIWPEVWLTSLTIMGTYVVVCSLYIVYTRPGMTETYMAGYGQRWDNSSLVDYQLKHRCCGWESASDRGLPVCPFDFQSGCAAVVRAHLTPRFKEIFAWSVMGLVQMMVTWVISLTVTMCYREANVFMCCLLLAPLGGG